MPYTVAEELNTTFFHTCVAHCFAECDRAADVVFIVFQRLNAGFADRLQPGEMNDRVDLLFLEDAVEPGAVTNIALIKAEFFTA